jgi:hypothetical protein
MAEEGTQLCCNVQHNPLASDWLFLTCTFIIFYNFRISIRVNSKFFGTCTNRWRRLWWERAHWSLQPLWYTPIRMLSSDVCCRLQHISGVVRRLQFILLLIVMRCHFGRLVGSCFCFIVKLMFVSRVSRVALSSMLCAPVLIGIYCSSIRLWVLECKSVADGYGRFGITCCLSVFSR